MIEILGGNLDVAFKELNIDAIKTYEGNTYLDNKTQIWEVKDKDFKRLCDMPDDEWKREWGWWRGSDGSNMWGHSLEIFMINGQEIEAWDGSNRIETNEKAEDEDDKYLFEREYCNLLEYLCDEIGASQPRNVCALAVDLAKINNMKLSELFIKYQD